MVGMRRHTTHDLRPGKKPGGGASAKQHGKQVIGYVPQWDGWKAEAGLVGSSSYNQLNIDYSQYTMLNFSFFGLAVDGSLHSADHRNQEIWRPGEIQEPADLIHENVESSYDKPILYGRLYVSYWVGDGDYAYRQGYRNYQGGWRHEPTGETGSFPLGIPQPGGVLGIVDEAHANGVKALAGIGGWSMSKHFANVAGDPEKRRLFCEECLYLVNELGFDGIDIDWEYPNSQGMNIEDYGPDDYANFKYLIQELRSTIGSGKLITACFSASIKTLQDPDTGDTFDWPGLSQVLDYFNMMTYDYNGGWSDKAGHNAPLYDYSGAEFPNFSLNATLEYLRTCGVDLAKVTFGVPFYGRGVITSGPAELNAPTVKRPEFIQPDGEIITCADYINWPKAPPPPGRGAWEGTPFYSALRLRTGDGSGWEDHWDDVAKVPYMTKDGFFLSYEDERSAAEKARFIADNGLAGAIVWEVFGDMEEMERDARDVAYKLKQCPHRVSRLASVINAEFASAGGARRRPPARRAPPPKPTARPQRSRTGR
jgi:chitinase